LKGAKKLCHLASGKLEAKKLLLLLIFLPCGMHFLGANKELQDQHFKPSSQNSASAQLPV